MAYIKPLTFIKMDQTTKTLFSFLLGLLTCTGGLRAQTWLAQDAVWHYGVLPSGGYETWEYVGDTAIDGWNAQKLIGTPSGVLFTSLQDSIVYTWADQAGTWAWDTLYRFNAVPGDRWWPINAETICPAPWGMLEVQDTSITVIGDIPLRTWTMAYLGEDGEPDGGPGFDVYDRIGSTIGLVPLPGGCIVVESSKALRCYADVDIPLYETGISPSCTFAVGVKGSNAGSTISLFPNPGTNNVTLKLEDGTRLQEIRVRDALGRTCLQNSHHTSSLKLDTRSLVPGFYSIEVQTSNGGLSVHHWIKE